MKSIPEIEVDLDAPAHEPLEINPRKVIGQMPTLKIKIKLNH